MMTRQPDTMVDGGTVERPMARSGPLTPGRGSAGSGATRTVHPTRAKPRQRPRSHSRAFTLIELMIVMEIIMILAGMALPSIKLSRKQADEASAVLALRQLSDAQELYRPRQSPPQYADSLEVLRADGLIDSNIGDSHRRSGYLFLISDSPDNRNTYAFTAVAESPGVTGDRSFYVDQTGVIRMAENGSATALSSPLQ